MQTILPVSQSRHLPVCYRSILFAVVGGITFFALAYASIALTRDGGTIAVVWLPNALSIAVLLRVRPLREDLFITSLALGSLAANLLHGFPPLAAVGLALANSVEIAAAVLLTRRWARVRPNMRHLEDLIGFAAAAGLVAPILSALIAVPVLAVLGAPLWSTALGWTVTDSTANLMIVPALLIVHDALKKRHRPQKASAIEWIGLTTFGLAVTAAVFHQNQFPFLFFVPLIVVLQAFRLGSLGTAALVSGISVVATVYTALGSGPINLVNYSFTTELLVLQTFLVSNFMIGLPIAAILERRMTLLREIRARQSELALLADNITDAVLQFDMHGLCIYASPSVEEVLGRPPGDFVGYTASERLHPDAREQIEDMERQLVSGAVDKIRFTYRRLLDDDQGLPVHIEADCAVACNHATGVREGILVSARDVSERVRLEEQLVRARRHAEAAALAKSQFLANMSHEIRTPMNGVLGFADLLRSSDLPPEAAHQARMIAQSGRSMMRILNDILDLSKIEAGEMQLDREAVDLRELVHDCIELQSGAAHSKGIALTCVIDEALPSAVISDPLRLQQMLLNLIGNAVKFTEAGRVEVRVSHRGERTLIAVSDTGIGIAENRMKAIFDPFVQAEGNTARRFGGSGLGLSITRNLAEMLGGHLHISSKLGAGSVFTLDLPFTEANRRRTDTARQTQAAIPDFAASVRVLLVEDHDVNRMLIGAMLDRCGLRADMAHGGNEGIEMALCARDEGRPYDLVLMDIQMPDCDGYEATRAIRLAGLEADSLPIIALTANAYREDVEAAKRAGMQAHLAKPLAFEQLVEALVRWLPHRVVEEPAPRIASPSPDVNRLWQTRRTEALDALRSAVEDGLRDPETKRQLARHMHKLAGTAGMFDEDALGQEAAALERRLLGEDDIEALRSAAHRVLDLAGHRTARNAA